MRVYGTTEGKCHWSLDRELIPSADFRVFIRLQGPGCCLALISGLSCHAFLSPCFVFAPVYPIRTRCVLSVAHAKVSHMTYAAVEQYDSPPLMGSLHRTSFLLQIASRDPFNSLETCRWSRPKRVRRQFVVPASATPVASLP